MSGIVRIGSGAGFAGDRIEPAVDLAERGRLDFLVFECLAERTIALAQLARRRDPAGGFDPLLETRMRAVLPAARGAGTRIITNMGAADPVGAMAAVIRIARELGLEGLCVAAIEGDDVLDAVRATPHAFVDRAGTVDDLGDAVVSANAYLGAGPIVEALDAGADIVITGRIGDPSLFLAPLIHAFGWDPTDWRLMGRGTLIGHLLECAGQLTGGYYADPGVKDVPDLARLGFPLAEVEADGGATLTKLPGTGGLVTPATCTEQLLYEVLDPAAYLQADVSADFTGVSFATVGPDRVRVSGGDGSAAPARLKVSVGYRDGYVGEGEMSYAGPGAEARARLAAEIVRERLRLTGVGLREWRAELIGVDAVHLGGTERSEPREVRVRVSGRTDTFEAARRIGAEVEALYTNGPAGGGGAVGRLREVLAIGSVLLDRDAVVARRTMEVA